MWIMKSNMIYHWRKYYLGNEDATRMFLSTTDIEPELKVSWLTYTESWWLFVENVQLYWDRLTLLVFPKAEYVNTVNERWSSRHLGQSNLCPKHRSPIMVSARPPSPTYEYDMTQVCVNTTWLLQLWITNNYYFESLFQMKILEWPFRITIIFA